MKDDPIVVNCWVLMLMMPGKRKGEDSLKIIITKKSSSWRKKEDRAASQQHSRSCSLTLLSMDILTLRFIDRDYQLRWYFHERVRYRPVGSLASRRDAPFGVPYPKENNNWRQAGEEQQQKMKTPWEPNWTASEIGWMELGTRICSCRIQDSQKIVSQM